MVIRLFEPSDAEEVADIMYRSFLTFLKERSKPPKPAEYWARRLTHCVDDDMETLAFVAEDDDGHVVGCLASTANLAYGLAGLDEIGVAPEAAGKGVGRQLFQAALKAWRERRMRKVWTDAASINPGAKQFYLKMGFVEEGIMRNHFFDGVDETVLALFLTYN